MKTMLHVEYVPVACWQSLSLLGLLPCNNNKKFS